MQNKIAYRYATDSFHLSKSHDGDTDRVYKIQNNMIFTSRKDEDVEMAYRAIAVDEERISKDNRQRRLHKERADVYQEGMVHHTQ